MGDPSTSSSRKMAFNIFSSILQSPSATPASPSESASSGGRGTPLQAGQVPSVSSNGGGGGGGSGSGGGGGGGGIDNALEAELDAMRQANMRQRQQLEKQDEDLSAANDHIRELQAKLQEAQQTQASASTSMTGVMAAWDAAPTNRLPPAVSLSGPVGPPEHFAAATAAAVGGGGEAELVQQLRAELEEARERAKDEYAKARKLRTEKRELENELSAVREEVQQLRQQQGEAGSISREAEREVQALRTEVDELSAELSAATEHARILAAEKVEVEERLRDKKRELGKLVAANREDRSRKLHLERQLGEAQRALEELSRKMFEETPAAAAAGDRVATVVKVAVLRHQKDKAEAAEAELRQRVSALQEQLSALEQTARSSANATVACTSSSTTGGVGGAESWDAMIQPRQHLNHSSSSLTEDPEADYVVLPHQRQQHHQPEQEAAAAYSDTEGMEGSAQSGGYGFSASTFDSAFEEVQQQHHRQQHGEFVEDFGEQDKADGRTPAAAGAATAAGEAAQAWEEVSRLELVVDKQAQDIRNLEEHVVQLQQTAAAARAAAVAIPQSNNTRADCSKCSELEEELARLQLQLQQLHRQLEEEQQQQQSVAGGAVDGDVVEGLRRRLTELEEQVYRQAKEIEQWEESYNEGERVTVSLRTQVDKLLSQAQQARQHAQAQVQEQVEELEEELRQAKGEVEHLRLQLAEAQEAAADRDAKAREVEELRSRLQEFEGRVEAQEEALATAREREEAREGLLREREATLSALEEQVAALERRLQDAPVLERMADVLQTRIQEKTAELDRLRTTLTRTEVDLSTSEQQATALQARLVALESAQQDAPGLHSQLMEAQAEGRRRQHMIDVREAEIVELKQRIQRLEGNSHAHSHSQGTRSADADREREVAAAASAAADAEAAAAAAAARRLEGLRAELDRAQVEVEKLQGVVAAQRQQLSDLQEEAEHYAPKLRRITQLESALEQARKREAELVAVEQSVRAQVQSDVALLQEQAESLMQEVQHLETAVREVERPDPRMPSHRLRLLHHGGGSRFACVACGRAGTGLGWRCTVRGCRDALHVACADR